MGSWSIEAQIEQWEGTEAPEPGSTRRAVLCTAERNAWEGQEETAARPRISDASEVGSGPRSALAVGRGSRPQALPSTTRAGASRARQRSCSPLATHFFVC